MKSLRIPQFDKRHIVFISADGDSGKKVVSYDGHKVNRVPSEAQLFDPVIAVYQNFGFTPEENNLRGDIGRELEILRILMLRSSATVSGGLDGSIVTAMRSRSGLVVATLHTRLCLSKSQATP